MSRLKRLKSIDDLIEKVRSVIAMNQCSLSEIDLNLLNSAIEHLEELKKMKGLTNKHLQIEFAKVVELITKYLIS